ncbi:MAG: hypothetical protein CMD16_02750 [Flavobacteriales bacterium]|nr:hypothetical protein [Flavobacteriales bacterium]|tara:strand:+ start:58652 stop:59446 length:795 start_codon:yes stop_codon:yes gene_type:complete
MLIICNGVFKSGSSWLHAIVIEVLRMNKVCIHEVPSSYTNNINSPTTIVESKLFDFLENEDYRKRNYITKSHYYQSKTLTRDYDSDIYFLFVERDVRDAIVSHYHHLKKKYFFIKGFNLYYFFIGRLKAFEILTFNQKYIEAFSDKSFFKYSEMKTNFESVVLDISSALGLRPLSEEEISVIKSNTSIKQMRRKLLSGEAKYYSTVDTDRDTLIRKGQLGDWLNYFSDSQKKDIKKIADGKDLFFLKIFYFILFSVRRRVFRIE